MLAPGDSAPDFSLARLGGNSNLSDGGTMRTKLRRSPPFFTVVSSALAVACAPAESPLTVYEFDCGVIRFESVAMFGIGDDETDVRDLFVPCYLSLIHI